MRQPWRNSISGYRDGFILGNRLDKICISQAGRRIIGYIIGNGGMVYAKENIL